jgi:hypothetical protein
MGGGTARSAERPLGIRAPPLRLKISLNQGAEWKTLIRTYIGTIPLRGDAPWAAEQSISGEPPPRTPVSSAMMAKVGAAARHSPSAAPRGVTLPLPAEPPAVSCRVAIMVADPCVTGQRLSYSSWRRHQGPVSLRPLGARSSHW